MKSIPVERLLAGVQHSLLEEIEFRTFIHLSFDQFQSIDLALHLTVGGLHSAWRTFYKWSFAQYWGPNCEAMPSEQFQAHVDTPIELGLPIMGAQGSP